MSLFFFLTTISAAQLVCHGIGDFLLQSEWMAREKTKSWFPAFAHVLAYSIPFVLVLKPSPAAWLLIVATHLLIDRFGLARYVSWIRLWLAPIRPPPFSECSKTGNPPSVPEHVSFWLMVIVDNLMHVIINAWALATF